MRLSTLPTTIKNREALVEKLSNIRIEIGEEKYSEACSEGEHLKIDDILYDILKQREVTDDS